MDTLKSMLGDNADEKIANIMNMLNSGDSPAPPPETHPKSGSSIEAKPDMPITPEMLLQAQQIMSRLSSSGNDDRAHLLRSLKPFVSEHRRDTIENAIRMLSMAQLSQFFKEGI